MTRLFSSISNREIWGKCSLLGAETIGLLRCWERLNSVYVLLVAVTKSYDLALLDVSTTHIYITGI